MAKIKEGGAERGNVEKLIICGSNNLMDLLILAIGIWMGWTMHKEQTR